MDLALITNNGWCAENQTNQNWIVWNWTVFDIETAYLCLTELFEIEQFLKVNLCTYAKVDGFK